MQSQPPLDHVAAISMLRRLDRAGHIGEMPFGEALGIANSLTHGHGQKLLNSLINDKLVTPIGGGALGLVRLTADGRKALQSGEIPTFPPIGPVSPSSGEKPPSGTNSMARENAGFVAALAAAILTISGVLEAIGVPDAQSNAAQNHKNLNLWQDAWFVAGLVIGVIGVLCLLSAAALYVRRRGTGRG